MTETIYGVFKTAFQAQAAADELSESGIDEAAIIVSATGLGITVHAEIDDGLRVVDVIERHGGNVLVDDIPNPGTIPDDPLEFSDDATE